MAGYSGSRLEYLTPGGVKARISRQRNPKLKTPPLRVLDTAFQNMCAKFRGLTRKNGVRNSRGHNFGRSIWTSLYYIFFSFQNKIGFRDFFFQATWKALSLWPGVHFFLSPSHSILGNPAATFISTIHQSSDPEAIFFAIHESGDSLAINIDVIH